MYLIEESAVKAYFDGESIPRRLWRWLQSEGPIIRAQAVATMPNGTIRFRSPEGMIDLPDDLVQEAIEP